MGEDPLEGQSHGRDRERRRGVEDRVEFGSDHHAVAARDGLPDPTVNVVRERLGRRPCRTRGQMRVAEHSGSLCQPEALIAAHPCPTQLRKLTGSTLRRPWVIRKPVEFVQ